MVTQLALYPDVAEVELGLDLLLELPPRQGRKKPKSNKKGSKKESLAYDRCQTPPIALHPLLPYLRPFDYLWECASGDGDLAAELERKSFTVERSDILTGQSFYTYQAAWPRRVALVTNPPYSDKYDWLKHCFELGIAFALLVPTDTIFAQAAIKLYRRYGRFRKPEFMSLDQRINFKMPNKGLEWVDEKGKKKKSSAQFNVLWLCHNILPECYVDGHIPRPDEVAFENQLVLQW